MLRYLDYFKGDPKGRAVMANWLRRAGRFRAIFEKTLERQGLPKDLIYVAMVESGFDTAARSRVGAGGVWQFMEQMPEPTPRSGSARDWLLRCVHLGT